MDIVLGNARDSQWPRQWRAGGLAVLLGLVSGCGGGGGSGGTAAGDSNSAPPPSGSGGSARALPQPFDVNITYARELTVAPSGNDTTGTGSAAAPYATIGRALTGIQPGTRVVVHAGTYAAVPSQANLRGTARAPIAIVARGHVVIDAGGAPAGMHFSDPAYVVLDGLTVQNASGNGVNIDDGGSYDTPAHSVVIRRLHVRQIGTGLNNDCLKLSGVDRFFVLDSEFHGCHAGDAIDMVGCHHGVVAGNYFHDLVGTAVQTKGGSADLLVHGNRFVDVRVRGINAGGSTGAPYYRPLDVGYEAARIRMTSNLFLRVGADKGAPVAFVGCDACVFANNTVIEPRHWVALILQESTDARFVPSRNGQFINNLIVFNTTALRSPPINVGPATAPATFVFGSNLWYALNDPAYAGPNYRGTGVPAESGSLIQRDPLLVNHRGGDYHLSGTSPAIRVGRSVPGGVPADYDGRAYGASMTIGAFAPP